MSTLSKEQLREIIKGNNFESVNDISTYLKNIFKDIIQEKLELELDITLGHSKNESTTNETTNSTRQSKVLYIHETLE